MELLLPLYPTGAESIEEGSVLDMDLTNAELGVTAEGRMESGGQASARGC